jgi:hypothetical protein
LPDPAILARQNLPHRQKLPGKHGESTPRSFAHFREFRLTRDS